MKFINPISALKQRLADNRRKRYEMEYRREMLRLTNLILQDSQRGLVKFYLEGKQSQVFCKFWWFSSVTDGGDPGRVIILRHVFLTTINILLSHQGQEPLEIDDQMPLFIVDNDTDEPLIQYLFRGDASVTVTEFSTTA